MVATVQGPNMALYQDGAVLSSIDAGQEPASLPRANHWLGRSSQPGDGYFQGAIKSMQIWSRALDAAEVASVYGVGGVCLVPPSAAPTALPTLPPALDAGAAGAATGALAGLASVALA